MVSVWLMWVATKSSYRDLQPAHALSGVFVGASIRHITIQKISNSVSTWVWDRRNALLALVYPSFSLLVKVELSSC